jgi:hypothetical protein
MNCIDSRVYQSYACIVIDGLLKRYIFERHQFIIDTCYIDSFFLVITTVYIVKKLCTVFGQASSVIEKNGFTPTYLTNHTKQLKSYLYLVVFITIAQFNSKINTIFRIDAKKLCRNTYILTKQIFNEETTSGVSQANYYEKNATGDHRLVFLKQLIFCQVTIWEVSQANFYERKRGECDHRQVIFMDNLMNSIQVHKSMRNKSFVENSTCLYFTFHLSSFYIENK